MVIHTQNVKKMNSDNMVFATNMTLFFLKPFMNYFAKRHIEMPDITREHIKDHNNTILYAGLHKSLWETLGVPYTIAEMQGKIPHVIMGNNLVKGQYAVEFFESIGVIFVDTSGGKKATIDLKNNIYNYMTEGENVQLFPEGTRSRNGRPKKFQSTGIEGAINASNKKNATIILFDVDYTTTNEDEYFIKHTQGKYTFLANHFFDWIKKLGDIYISFSEPIKIENQDRKELTHTLYEKCLDMVKILPVNIVSEAMIKTKENNRYLDHNIENVVKTLEHEKDKFRGFSINDDPETILKKSKMEFSEDMIPIYNIYSGYIKHYLEKNPKTSK